MNTPSDLFDLYRSYLGVYDEEPINEDVEYVLDYLIDEGFTDSYESALAIVEAMSDEWYEQILEVLSPKQLEKMKREHNAREERIRKTGHQLTPRQQQQMKDIMQNVDEMEKQIAVITQRGSQRSLEMGGARTARRRPTTNLGSVQIR